jgi:hypothetical protein
MELSEFAKNLSVIIGALALISGIRAWKREYIGKRKIELAEDTLMLFYQARDAIRGKIGGQVLDYKIMIIGGDA